MTKKYKEIYQRIKKENPCIFCIRSDGGCQLKGNKCDSTSLKMYYERNHLEIESILKDIYIKGLEKENEQLKQQIEKTKCCHSCKSHKLNDLKNCQTCDENYSKWELAE